MNVWDLSSLGIEFAIIILIFVFGGNYLDTKFNFSPWALLFCTFLGFGIGMYHIVIRANSLNDPKNK